MTEKLIHSGTLSNRISRRELFHNALAREIAAEGIVLLKNDDVLPLNLSSKIALLGSGAVKTVKGGIGSGDVNNREDVSIYEGMKAAGAILTSEQWLADYSGCYEDARLLWKEKVLTDAQNFENVFDAYSSNPFSLPDGREITDEDICGADAAVYVISRIAGEGKDRRLCAGDYYLSEKEVQDIRFLAQNELPIILIINAGGLVELTDLLTELPAIKAVLNYSQPGQQGGHAAADVLFGKKSPCGKLTATWAKRYYDYPASETFGYLNGDLSKDEYKEGVYVGYRFFDSHDIKPLFPFGYGLSYTSFDIKYNELRTAENGFEADVTVTNTGSTYAAKEVVQLYISMPQTGEAREYHRLGGFAKTGLLKAKESQKLTISVAQKQLAVFSEELHAWYVEKGNYGIWIGNSSASLKLAAVLHVEEQVILENVKSICPLTEKMEETGAVKNAMEKEQAWLRLARREQVPEVLFVPQKEVPKKITETLAAEQSIEELVPMLYGNITEGASTLGSAGIRVPGSAGETSEALEEKYHLRSLIMADGPAGLRLRQSYQVDKATDTVYGGGVLGSLENGFLEPMVYHDNADTYYQYCTAFPVGTALAQTWNLPLIRKFGKAVAEEMKEFTVDLWLAPGLNIQRNPLCGRNFEYYSEDPLLSGEIAAAVTEGVQSQEGCGVTIKHFACNNQEDNRMSVDVHVTEKTLREIYLRGFEIAVKKSAPAAVMTSYNLINGVHSANSKDLCTVVLREEWGFDGIIMSDWNTTVPEDGSIPWKCAASGNDIIMPGCPNDKKNIMDAYTRGELTEYDIRSCAGRLINTIKRFQNENEM